MPTPQILQTTPALPESAVLARQRRLRRALGTPPDGYLRALIAFAERELPESLAWEDYVDTHETLRLIVGHGPLGLGVPPALTQPMRADLAMIAVPPGELAEVQAELRGFFDVAVGRAAAYEPRYQVTSSFLHVEDAPHLRRTITGPLPAQVIEATWLLLHHARGGTLRLRVCPHVLDSGQPCGRLFLGTRTTKLYCTPAHTAAEAWAAYWKRQGFTRSKKKTTKPKPTATRRARP